MDRSGRQRQVPTANLLPEAPTSVGLLDRPALHPEHSKYCPGSKNGSILDTPWDQSHKQGLGPRYETGWFIGNH